MAGFPRGKTAIVGAATFGIGEVTGYSELEVAVMASLKALKAAHLKPSDADALFICLPNDALSGLSFAEYLGVQPLLTDNNRTGGSTFLSHVQTAALALDARLCRVALIAYGSRQRTLAGKLQTPLQANPFEAVYRPRLPVAAYALAAARHMHEFGTRREHLAEVAVAARHWANLNPEAYHRGVLSIDDVLNSPMVADPLSRLDCCLVTDGGGAIVMTRADEARTLSSNPVYVLAAAAATSHMAISMMPDLTTTAAMESGKRAYAQAGVRPDDIDVVQLYDAFTINPILFLEDLGFCPKGEGGRFIADGKLRPGGALPFNTNGGGLSCVHPGMYGIFTLIEAAEQIRGTAGARQLPAVELALAHANGGFLSSQATVILGSGATV